MVEMTGRLLGLLKQKVHRLAPSLDRCLQMVSHWAAKLASWIRMVHLSTRMAALTLRASPMAEMKADWSRKACVMECLMALLS